MKKIMAMMMSVCSLGLSPMAVHGGEIDVDAAVRDYVYDMTVVWDQRDETFRKDRETALSRTLDEALRAGIPLSRVVGAVTGEFHDARIQNALERVLKAQDRATLRSILHELPQAGADTTGTSYSGRQATGYMILGITVTALIIGLMVADCANHTESLWACPWGSRTQGP